MVPYTYRNGTERNGTERNGTSGELGQIGALGTERNGTGKPTDCVEGAQSPRPDVGWRMRNLRPDTGHCVADAEAQTLICCEKLAAELDLPVFDLPVVITKPNIRRLSDELGKPR